jgi:hypothetical protein
MVRDRFLDAGGPARICGFEPKQSHIEKCGQNSHVDCIGRFRTVPSPVEVV